MMTEPPFHITLVSHTHWDREWYQPFQVFRFQLVELIDHLIELLDSDPAYHSFLLDGQTIILEDYLAIRPEREAELRRFITAGRLLIGPWHILPDEFLVSPEATVRNLMLGAQVCARFGARMPVGYTPDPFGHVSQLPQILAGCGLEALALQRGLSDEPTELWWEAPDGTRLLTIYFRAGYGNFAWAPTTPDAFTRAVERQIDQLAPYAHTPHLLLMNGTDHMMPQPELPGLIAAANERLAGRAVLVHDTLPDYVRAIRADLNGDIPTIKGELRSSKRSPVLPGVYSARMWIKQRNHACQVALESYAEPLSAFVRTLGGPDRTGEIGQAWRYLIENHPHDSICGCSVDQVHDEMRTRFDWSQQLTDKITDAGLRYLASHINIASWPIPSQADDPNPPDHTVVSTLSDQITLVYNPAVVSQSGAVEIVVPWAGPRRHYHIVDDGGQTVPYRVAEGQKMIFESLALSTDERAALLDQIEIGFYKGRLISDVNVWFEGNHVRLELVLPEYHTGRIGSFTVLVKALRADPRWHAVQDCHLTTYLADNFRLAFMAQDVPGVGYRAYRLAQSYTDPAILPQFESVLNNVIENEWFRVIADPQNGWLTVTDKSTGRVYQGLNRIEDGGDRGDEYNYNAPAEDTQITAPVEPPNIERQTDGFGESLVVRARYAIPADLTLDRRARTSSTVDMPVTSTIRLTQGVRRLDVRTEFVNVAQNHRLRVLFPTGLQSDHVIVDGHFDRLSRPLIPADEGEDWAERPTPTAAQRAFSAIAQDGYGLLVAARGLPEYEHLQANSESVLALTLLRSVGWLSCDDLDARPGHAGPARATPGAQCLGPAVVEYSLIPFGDSFDLNAAAQDAYAFIMPLQAITAASAEGMLPNSLPLITLSPAELVLTAIKPAESGDNIVVRFYNSSTYRVSGHLSSGLPIRDVVFTDLLEKPTQPAEEWILEHNAVSLNIPAKRIVTLQISLGERP